VKVMKTRVLWGAVFFLYFTIITVPVAHAYVDPGTGSYIFQVLVGVFLGVAVALKLWWRRLWGFVTRKPSTKATESTAEVSETPAPADKDS
jgi:cytochrome b561